MLTYGEHLRNSRKALVQIHGRYILAVYFEVNRTQPGTYNADFAVIDEKSVRLNRELKRSIVLLTDIFFY